MADSELLAELRQDVVDAGGGTVLAITYPAAKIREFITALESAAADRETIRIAAAALSAGFVSAAADALRAALESKP